MPAQFPNSDPASATPQATPFDTILAQCRDLVCERLCQAMSGMLDQVDAALGALISETRDATTQKLYAQTRDKALAQRETIEKQFRARYLREFQQRSNRVKKIGDSFSDIDLSSLELELVGDEDLDESLKFNAMAAKLRQYCDEELIALDQRVGVLLGDASLQAEDNPFTPQAICDAYKDTCRQIDANVEVRMVMLRLFDDYVADEIRAVYKAVNALLVQNSILPKIRIQARKDASKPPVRPPAEPPKPAAPAEQKPADGEQDLFSILKTLRAGAQPPAGGGAGAGIAAGAAGVPGMTGVPGVSSVPGAAGGVPTVLQGPELLGMLTRIQLGDPGAMPANLVPMAAPGVDPGLANVLHGLKASSVGAGMNQLDMLTLDIMSLVFDQLFDDPKIPVGVKGLIGRLQIPMLKVAIADKTFFSKKTHPARQLLDALGEMSLRLPADFNAANPLFGRMEVVLQEVIDGFEDKMEIFDVARGRLEALIAEEDQRVAQETIVAATRVEQKEKLALAKTVAQAEIKMRARVSEVPREVMEFLAQQWVQLLLIVHVTEGEDSEAWKTALETMDLLIWSVEPKDSAEERRDLVAVVPELLKGVAAGLRAASVDDAVRNSFFAELRKLHDKVLGKAEADAGAAPQDQETDRAGVAAKTEAGSIDEKTVEIAAPAEAVAAGPAASTPEPAATLPPVVSPAADSAAVPAPAPAVEAPGAPERETTTAPAVPGVPESAAEPVAQAVSLPAPDAAPPSDAKPASLPDLEMTPPADVTTPPGPAAEPAPVPGSEKAAEPVAKTEAIPDLDFAPAAAAATPTVPVVEGAPAPGIEKAAEPVANTEAIPDLDFVPVAAAATPPVSVAEGAPAPGIEKAAEPVAKTEAIPDLDFAPVAAAATPPVPVAEGAPAAGIEKAAEPVAEKTGGEPDLDFVLPPAAQKSPASEAAFLPDLEFTPAAAPAPAAQPTPPQVAAPAFVLDLELPSAPATPAQSPKPADLPDLEFSPAPPAEPVPASTPAATPGAEFVSFPELNFTPAPATPPAPAATAAPAPAPAAEPEFKLELKRVVKPAPAATPAPAPAARPGAAAPMQPAVAPVAKPGAAPAVRPPISPAARPGAAPPAQRPGAPAPHPAAPAARQPAPAAATKPATSAAQPLQRPAVPGANPAAVPVRQPVPAAGSAPAARMPPPVAQRAAVPGAKPSVAPTAPRTAAPATPAARPAVAAGVRPPTRPIARPASMPPASARAQPPRAESKVSDSLDFTAPVTIENPFGGGKVEVEDLDFTTKPAAGTAGAKQATAAALPPGLAIGTWVGIRGKDEKEPRKSAKLSFISPLKTRYLFVDKQGKTTLDCTRADLARRFQIGEVIIMDKVPDVPLFDRITEGLVGKLGGGAAKK